MRDMEKEQGYRYWLLEYSHRHFEMSSLYEEYKKLRNDFIEAYSFIDANDVKETIFSLNKNIRDDCTAILLALDSLRLVSGMFPDIERMPHPGPAFQALIEFEEKYMPFLNMYDNRQKTLSRDIIDDVINDRARCNYAPPSLSVDDARVLKIIENYSIDKDGVTFNNIRANFNCDINNVLNEIKAVFRLIQFVKKTHASYPTFKEYLTHGKQYFAPEHDSSNTPTYKKNNYSIKSNLIRAVGIWLWDYAKENNCSVAAAVREIRRQSFWNNIGCYNSPDRHLERAFAKTSICIEQGEVHLMS